MPQYQHTAASVFLGRYIANGASFDLLLETTPQGPVLVARFGNDQSEQVRASAALANALFRDITLPIGNAYHRAIEYGLL